MGNKITKLEKEYNRLYGHLPDDDKSIMEYLMKKFPVTPKKMRSEIERIEAIQWKEAEIILPLIPHPSPRPRNAGGHFYVKGAKEHRKAVKNLIKSNGIICTAVKTRIDIYQPIPLSSMTNTEIHLAQLGYVNPTSGGDWDNFAKTYCDAIQGYLILNDNIIIDGQCVKHYALKPYVKIKLEYADDYDSKFNKRKIINSISYKNMIADKEES